MKTFIIIIGTLCLISGLIELIVPALMRNISKKILPKINNRKYRDGSDTFDFSDHQQF
ncbi:MAG: hypothetical protein Q7K21_03915 [Elusimicrobiota bacterium]|nr:hypothetical protein [Elusimicrobiota bacterium]